MISMITANKARAKTEFARSVDEYIDSFNGAVEYRADRGEDHMLVQKDPRMSKGQWFMFIELIEKAGYRIVQQAELEIEVFW